MEIKALVHCGNPGQALCVERVQEVSPCLYKHPKGLMTWWGALRPTWAILQV